jgi:ABC-type bacteriocin/lantibiotic exporter with double-glycine peptidase domain
MKWRRLFAPEVVQTSDMDCGPASLKCLLEGFGRRVSYGRLREACQTDVDGTCIDTLEDITVRLGLEAEQVMLPVDHLFLPEFRPLPALVVVRLPNGLTHFVIAWRRFGPWVQMMDPAVGRRWQSRRRFLKECYVHTASVPAVAWKNWASSEAGLRAMKRRLRRLGLSRKEAHALASEGAADSSWKPLAALDAAIRMTESVVRSGVREAGRIVRQLWRESELIPESFWSVREDRQPDQVSMRGAVLISVRGAGKARPGLPPELTAALSEAPSRPGRKLLELLAAGGRLAPAALLLSLVLAAAGVTMEAVLFRGFIDLGRELGLSGQRAAATLGLLLFSGLLLFLEFPLSAAALRLGRRLEMLLRIAFLEKIPRLGDRYFHSRPKSDMTQRCHSIHQIRRLPHLASQFARSLFELLFTTAGIIWLDPGTALAALVSAAVGLVLPFALQPMLTERDLRVRSHSGAMSRYYLDALLGMTAIRAHGAERALRREHEGVLAEWAHAAFRLQRLVVRVEVFQLLAGFAITAWLLFGHLARHRDSGGALLLIYWALNLPALGQEIAQAAWQYPGFRNTTLRLLEPLGALEETGAGAEPGARPLAVAPRPVSGAALKFENVSVVAGGHTILSEIDLDLEPGARIAIVGASGAGKSSLVGLLLGWHRPAAGRILLDGKPVGEAGIESLRRQTAWVDPSVHLWNRSFLENLRYGSANGGAHSLPQAIAAADLVSVLERAPDGMQTILGERGSLFSGGEGQRVRLGRAVLRDHVRLAILDEPFRGLGREQRRELFRRAAGLWEAATVICITHDVGETRGFPRVLVMEAGRVVEDGDPNELAARPESRYRALLEAEESVREGLWSGDGWMRLRMEEGALEAGRPYA